ncbi:SGNH/GDSL hydrolase family protein [Aeromicrobium sp. 9AM]|uniref:SGNH/GDSL hydrolase family protein n=1 Tax=Aeromicrobium sp. 9AM TaxID=2653126 RepID=UPI0012F22516|nr:SGNH/GDSL hydrolase family protein [Aeromicrobium sp. 9AM]VXC20455.1 conserved exported hypothetical protein [Aeromicrobium sp. 9AM]
MRARIAILVAAVLTALTITSASVTSPAQALDTRSGVVLVFGDSITQRYTDDPKDPQQGWWSFLAYKRDLYPVTSAQGGGGLIKKGYSCTGTAVRERSAAVINRVKPDEIWIAVGVNDTKICKNGKAITMSASFRTRAATAYFKSLAAQADSMGISRKNIYVTVPWGINGLSYRKAIVETYSATARAAGLQFVNVPHMDSSMTQDGTHPRLKGSLYIYRTLRDHMKPHVGPLEPTEAPTVTSIQ